MDIQSFHTKLDNKGGLFEIVALKDSLLTVKVLDTDGRIAQTIKTKVERGNQALFVNFSGLHSGNYVINAFAGGMFVKSIRFHID